jgi:hypothetical protein
MFDIVHWLIVVPLRLLYFEGPRWMGCFAGMPSHDMCASLTSSSSDNWVTLGKEPSDACKAIMERSFRAFYVGTAVPFYFVCMFVCVKMVLDTLKLVAMSKLGARLAASPKIIYNRLKPKKIKI